MWFIQCPSEGERVNRHHYTLCSHNLTCDPLKSRDYSSESNLCLTWKFTTGVLNGYFFENFIGRGRGGFFQMRFEEKGLSSLNRMKNCIFQRPIGK